MWGYYWGLTKAQIELLTIDKPLVVYPKHKKARKKGEPMEFKKPRGLDVMQTADKWQSKYGGEGKKLSLSLNNFKKLD